MSKSTKGPHPLETGTAKQTNGGYHAPLKDFPLAFSTAILILLVAALVWGVL